MEMRISRHCHGYLYGFEMIISFWFRIIISFGEVVLIQNFDDMIASKREEIIMATCNEKILSRNR